MRDETKISKNVFNDKFIKKSRWDKRMSDTVLTYLQSITQLNFKNTVKSNSTEWHKFNVSTP